MAGAAESDQRWLYGPLPGLLLGCGLLYVALFVAFLAVGPAFRAATPVSLFPILMLLLATPHAPPSSARSGSIRTKRQQGKDSPGSAPPADPRSRISVVGVFVRPTR